MKDLNKIDELLKEQMLDFTPDVPVDVWAQISSNISAGPAPVNPVSSFTFGVKAAIVTGIATLAGASYLFFGVSEKSEKVNTASIVPSKEPIQNEIAINNPEKENTKVDNGKTGIPFNQAKKSFNKKDKLPENSSEIQNQTSPSDFIKSEHVSTPEIPILKQESLVSVDSKTEVIEGNPEQETHETINHEEHKLNEPELKKEHPIVNNAFSPNGDGMNDELVIEMPPVDFYHLRIFTKKGVLVFETENVQTKWKGQILGSGIAAENGEYRYIIEYQAKGKEAVKAIGGYIYLNR